MALRLVTRGSALALAQSQKMAARIEALGVKVELLTRSTKGDAITDRPFTSMEGKGFFTKELEEALLSNEADLAVHSLKDLPIDLPDGLDIASIPERADPADVLLVRRGAVDPNRPLPVKPGSRVGTTSSRRKAQWLARRPDTTLLDLRGNVPTRVEKLRRGDFDAILLAAAGLERLGLDTSEFAVKRLDPSVFVSAPGQGALALEIRTADRDLRELLHRLENADARDAVRCERAVLAGLGGGCSEPVGAFARRRGRRIVLDAVLGPEPGGAPALRRARADGATWDEVVKLALRTLREPSSEIRRTMLGKVVVLTHQAGRAELLARELEERGAQVLNMPLVETRPIAGGVRQALDAWNHADYVALTSASAAEALFGPATSRALGAVDRGAGPPRVCAIGDATAVALEERGIPVAFHAGGMGAEALAAALFADARTRNLARARVLFPRSSIAGAEFVNALTATGFHVESVAVYTTVEREEAAGSLSLPVPADSVVFFSPSAVRAFARIRPFESRQWVAAGETTLRELERAGFPSPRAARSPVAQHIVESLG